MTRLTLLILIFISLLAGSCSGRKNKLDQRNMIPEKELTAIITDIYLTDGLLTLPKIHHWYSQRDSLSSYKEVIEKHGYTIDNLNKTIKYYYIKKPKVLIKIYDQALGILSGMESQFEKETLILQSHVSNLWNGKEFYSFPDFTGADSTSFDITPNTLGLYMLSLKVTLYPDDQTVNPRMTVYTCNPDSIKTGKRHYIKTIPYIKDGQPHTYSLKIISLERSALHIGGILYDYDNSPDESGKKIRIEKISYTYTSATQ
jgi:hypothetical protein